MNIAILTMFNGLSSTYSLVNVVADQIKMLLKADVNIKVLVSENCPEEDRKGIFANENIEWIKITNTLNGKILNGMTIPKMKVKYMIVFLMKLM